MKKSKTAPQIQDIARKLLELTLVLSGFAALSPNFVAWSYISMQPIPQESSAYESILGRFKGGERKLVLPTLKIEGPFGA
jgi:hypothetical protein